MLNILPWWWRWAALAIFAAACAAGGGALVYDHEEKSVVAPLQAAYDKFRLDTKVAGQVQEVLTAKTVTQQIETTRWTNAQWEKIHSGNRDTLDSLLADAAKRDSGRSIMSGVSGTADSATTGPVCFDREILGSKLGLAMESLRLGVRQLREGDAGVIRFGADAADSLGLARDWAASQSKVMSPAVHPSK